MQGSVGLSSGGLRSIPSLRMNSWRKGEEVGEQVVSNPIL